VLLNFLSNAIKFTHSGSISLFIDYLGEEDGKVVLEFCVIDTGIGIPDDVQGAIFEAFQQADGSVTRKYGGTGLGLAISSRLMGSFGGRIWLESEPGQGSSFHFSAKLLMPAKQDENPLPDPADDLRTASS
jgi:signal transduction histidine kinase